MSSISASLSLPLYRILFRPHLDRNARTTIKSDRKCVEESKSGAPRRNKAETKRIISKRCSNKIRARTGERRGRIINLLHDYLRSCTLSVSRSPRFGVGLLAHARAHHFVLFIRRAANPPPRNDETSGKGATQTRIIVSTSPLVHTVSARRVSNNSPRTHHLAGDQRRIVIFISPFLLHCLRRSFLIAARSFIFIFSLEHRRTPLLSFSFTTLGSASVMPIITV